jgi:outer membrane protein TolC
MFDAHRSIRLIAFTTIAVSVAGCMPAQQYRTEADRVADRIIAEKQQQALDRAEPLTVERPADTLRKRLLLGQALPYSSNTSLGVQAIEPGKHWPDDNYLKTAGKDLSPALPGYTTGPLRLSLLESLQVAAHNNTTYQARKELVYLTALDLDLARDEFRTTFFALLENNTSADYSGDDPVKGNVTSTEIGLRQRFMNGLNLTTLLALDLAKLLTGDGNSSLGIAWDTTITLPLLRGAGRHIVTEPLTQAERNVVYALWEFEQFKREFAVDVASQYLEVLQDLDEVQNTEASYRRLVLAARRSTRMAHAGRLPEIQVDQAVQQELTARDRWIRAIQTYQSSLDTFKTLVGLPADADIELEREELDRLARAAQRVLADIMQPASEPTTAATSEATPAPATMPLQPLPATQEIHIEPPGMKGAGPYELPERRAINLALENRPDLLVAQGEVIDAERRVVVAANALLPGLDLAGTAAIGERRGLGSADQPNAQLRPERGRYDLGVLLDLPVERTAERNFYRQTIITLEQQVRQVQQLEDDIKLDVRRELRDLLSAREGVVTQAQAVTLAQRRVQSTDMLLQAGRAEIRDVLEAQTDLVDAQNEFTEALVEYRISELELQRDMGVLQVNHEGVWREYDPAAPEPEQP